MVELFDRSELEIPAPEAAKRLLGCELIREYEDGTRAKVRIVETEAYDEMDPASHTFRGKTLRNKSMYGPAGHLYVYFIYGMHYCCNVVTGKGGSGEAVLIRAVEPIEGEVHMQYRRSSTGVNISNGPAKVCKSLDITRHMDGHDLMHPPLLLQMQPRIPEAAIVAALRIGVRNGSDTPWRFFIAENKYVSR